MGNHDRRHRAVTRLSPFWRNSLLAQASRFLGHRHHCHVLYVQRTQEAPVGASERCENEAARCLDPPASMTITVIIPTLNEASTIAATIGHTATLGFDEIVVVDGGSSD